MVYILSVNAVYGLYSIRPQAGLLMVIQIHRLINALETETGNNLLHQFQAFGKRLLLLLGPVSEDELICVPRVNSLPIPNRTRA